MHPTSNSSKNTAQSSGKFRLIEGTKSIVTDYKIDGIWQKYTRRDDGKQVRTKAFKLWENMRNRCGIRALPSYADCSISSKFQDFQFFCEWCQTQIGYHSAKFQLDKDVLIRDNKIYGPEGCSFIPARINSLLLKREACRGPYPIGVSKAGKKFRAKCSDINGKQYTIGIYSTVEDAFRAYKEYKEQLVYKLAERYKSSIEYAVYISLATYRVLRTD